MSMEDYRKAQKDEKDSTIVEIQLTKDGTEHFGYGIPYSILNTDTLCNGKRRGVWGYWSPDSKHFVTIVSDDRKVKDSLGYQFCCSASSYTRDLSLSDAWRDGSSRRAFVCI